MEVKSHIQIPKCVLKQFEKNDGWLFHFNKKKYDIDRPIQRGHAKSLNTEYGYYSDDVEDRLNSDIETPLGRLLSCVAQIDFQSKNIILPTNFEITIRKYAYSLLCRSEQILKSLTEKTVYFQFFSKKIQHDFAVTNGLKIAKDIELFKDWHMAFAINNTDSPFVLPLFGVFSFDDGEHKYLHMPINPKIAATLIYNSHLEGYYPEGAVPIIYVSDEQQIFKINQIGCQFEMENNRGVCISNDKEYLKTVISSLMEI